MRALMRFLGAVGAAGAMTLASATVSGSRAGAAPTWQKLSQNTEIALAQAGLLRAGDGDLHVVWSQKHAGTSSLRFATLSSSGSLLTSGKVLAGWAGVQFDPDLVPVGSGLRVVFTGSNGKSGSPYNLGAVYSATSANGTSWTLAKGSLSHSTIVTLSDNAAIDEANGTPLAAWSAGDNLAFHVGVDPTVPATQSDHSVPTSPGGFVIGPALARTKAGVWAAWYSSGGSGQGYYVDQITPAVGTRVKAPGSGGSGLSDNEPHQSVAFVRKVNGSPYLAYCVPTVGVPCAHIDLWKVGSSSALLVPGTATGSASHVTLSSTPGGKLWIAWYDSKANQVRATLTNSSVTTFGKVHQLAPPPNSFAVDSLVSDASGSTGALDLVALASLNVSGAPPTYWHLQLP